MTDHLYEAPNGVRLRKVKESDLKDLLDLKNESWFGTHKVSILNEQDQKRWFESLDKDVHSPKNLILVAGDKDTPGFGLVKLLNMDWVSRTAELGWDVYKEHRGKGYCGKLNSAGCLFAKNVLNLRRLNADILENNEASLKCAYRVGFVKEGLRRKAIYKNGEYINSVVIGLLLEEFIFPQ